MHERPKPGGELTRVESDVVANIRNARFARSNTRWAPTERRILLI
jgi:hypothetical protein